MSHLLHQRPGPVDWPELADHLAPHRGDVLLVAPLPRPPLLGGIETGVQMLLASGLSDRWSMRLFNTARAADPDRPLAARVAFQIGSALRLVWWIGHVRPRIVHVKSASHLHFYQSATYAWIARLLGRRVILQLHAGDFPAFVQGAGGLGRAVIRWSLRAPTALMALSECWAAYFRQLAAARLVTVVPNGLPIGPFAAATPDRARFAIPAGAFAVLFVGTRDPRFDVEKGLEDLVAAVARVRAAHPDIILVYAGGCADHEALTAALGPAGTGWLDVGLIGAADKETLFRSVDVFCLPSRFENMPNTVLEAMAAGLPVVATPVGAVPEMIADGQSGLLLPVGDRTRLADCLTTLYGDPTLRQRLGATAATTVRAEFDFPRVEERLEAIYTTLAAPVPSAAGSFSTPVLRASPLRWSRRPAIQRLLRVRGRLAEMSPREIAHRIGRVVAKRRRALGAVPRGLDPAAAAELGAAAAAFLSAGGTCGFFTPAERAERVVRIRALLPAEVDRTLSAADAILRDGLELLGRHVHPADPSFDWQADPGRGRLWPATVMDDADAVRRVAADVKFVWEVNRHQFLATLGRAYAYSGDERYAAAAIGMVRRWIESNPYPLGVNWSSNLEVAVRALSWVWTIHYLLGSAALDETTLARWLASLAAHRDHLEAHLSIYTDPTNHLIGEAAALAVLGTWLGCWPRSDVLRELAVGTLTRECERQVADDGVGREQSTSYQRFVLDFVLQVIALLDRGGVAVPPALRARAGKLADAVGILVGPGGRAPRIGDGDDARGIPFTTADPWDFRECGALAAAVLGRRDLAGVLGPAESALWITGNGVPSPDAAGAPAPRSAVLPDGGYAVLYADPETRLLFDIGPLGYLPHASHGHADLLSVLVDVAGEEMLVDTGTFTYWDEMGRRNVFRATRAHNTVEVGGHDQACAFDRFKWLNIPAHGVTAVRLDGPVEYVEAWHDGYTRLRPPVRHRRAVVGFAGAWMVVDWLEGSGEQWFARRFHCAPGARLDQESPGAVRVARRRGALLVQDVSGTAAAIAVRSAPYSERYAQLGRTPVLEIVERATLPAVRATLLAPLDGDGRPVASVEASGDPGRRSFRITRPAAGVLHLALTAALPASMQAPRAIVTYDGPPGPIAFTSGADESSASVSLREERRSNTA